MKDSIANLSEDYFKKNTIIEFQENRDNAILNSFLPIKSTLILSLPNSLIALLLFFDDQFEPV